VESCDGKHSLLGTGAKKKSSIALLGGVRSAFINPPVGSHSKLAAKGPFWELDLGALGVESKGKVCMLL